MRTDAGVTAKARQAAHTVIAEDFENKLVLPSLQFPLQGSCQHQQLPRSLKTTPSCFVFAHFKTVQMVADLLKH